MAGSSVPKRAVSDAARAGQHASLYSWTIRVSLGGTYRPPLLGEGHASAGVFVFSSAFPDGRLAPLGRCKSGLRLPQGRTRSRAWTPRFPPPQRPLIV